MDQTIIDFLNQKDAKFAELLAQNSALITNLDEAQKSIDALQFQNTQLNAQLADVQEQLRLALRPAWEVKADNVIAVAMKYYQQHIDSGKTKFPYDFGANPVLGSDGTVVSGTFDCSSFTKQCYKEGAGIVLPRVSKDQALQGQAVDKPRKGDEVFFNTNLDKDKIVDHCGIMKNDDEFIHTNPSGQGINIKRLSDSWGSKYFLFVRRIIL